MAAELKQLQQFCPTEDSSQFLQDVLTGLSSNRKYLSSKYFYDSKGSRLFNEITHHPDYYLTNCEIEILHRYKNRLSQLFGQQGFNLIELGPGEGIKTRLLLDQFLKDGHDFTYYTIDISEKYLSQIVKKFNKELSQLKLVALNADYFEGLQWLTEQSKRRNVVLFLGSSIGNFTPTHVNIFLRSLWQDLQKDDYLYIGFDLRKDTKLLLQAYNDRAGLTKEFNLNILRRINRELEGHFDPKQFTHYGTYNVHNGAMESYLINMKEDDIFIGKLNRYFHFGAYEPIHLEYSFKYTLSQIEEFAVMNGFAIVEHYFDEKRFFADTLWQVVK